MTEHKLSEQDLQQIREEAVDIPGYPGFKAHKKGLILGRRGYPVTGYSRKNKYIEITVFDVFGNPKVRRAHQLIATALIPNPDGKSFINHKNGIKTDNRVENLEWCTIQENIKHAWETGLSSYEKFPRGGNHPQAKISEDSAKQILKLKGSVKQAEIARMFNIAPATVWNVLYGKSWAHLKKQTSTKTTTP